MIDNRRARGTLKTQNAEYIGQLDSEGLYTGYSQLMIANGNKYHGDFEAGVKHGNGVMRYMNGDKFTGEFKDGKIHEGQMIFEG